MQSGASARWPGLALLSSVLIPTGRPADQARDQLATDATGIGAVEGTVGFWVEQVYGAWVLSGGGWAGQRAPRGSSHFGPRVGGIASVSRRFSNRLILAGYFTGYHQFSDSASAGANAPARLRLTTTGMAFGYSFTDEWRLQGGRPMFRFLPGA